MTGVPSDPLERLRRSIGLKDELQKNLASELFGTFVFVFIGLCGTMQAVLTYGTVNAHVNVSLAWGLGLMLCLFLTSNTSGGHLNPAVSFLMATLGRMRMPQCLMYGVAQTTGSFLAAALAYAVYHDQLYKYTSTLKLAGVHGTAKCFTSMPDAGVTHLTAFVDQVVGTAILCLFIAAVTDKRNKVPACLQPVAIGLTVVAVASSLAVNVGGPINPARDLGPRLFAYLLYGNDVFSFDNNYFWIPTVAPFVGAVIGGWSYHLIVGIHLDEAVPVVDEERAGPDDDRHEQKRLIKGANTLV